MDLSKINFALIAFIAPLISIGTVFCTTTLVYANDIILN